MGPGVARLLVQIPVGIGDVFGLHDAVLIKDNHIAIAGSLPEAIRRARSGVGHLVALEFEVDTLEPDEG